MIERLRLAIPFVFIVTVGCGPRVATGTSLAAAPAVAPISVAGKVRDTLIYLGVDLSQVSPRVGAHYEGLLKVRQFYIDLSPSTMNTWAGWMRDFGRQELEAAGYRLKVPSSLFSQFEKYDGVRYALAGRPVMLRNDTYGSLAGNKTESAVQIAWEVLDVRSRAVVYRMESSGEAVTAGNSGDAVAAAFRAAVRRLLASSAFVDALTTVAAAPSATAVSDPSVKWRRVLPSEADMIRIEDPLRDAKTPVERATAAVVSLKGNSGSGSAFLISRDGLAITNYHVLEGQSSVKAQLADGLDRAVRVIRADSATDLALIEIYCPTDCAFLAMSGAQSRPGDDVLAVGAPLSLSRSVTKGIVSALRRQGTVAVIQTDAAISPGNSGGPLVDAKTGAVVGIVSSKFVSRGAEGLGFAISIADAMRVLGVVR